MQTDNRFLDDMARMMVGAMSAAGSMREEVEARLRQQAEAFVARMDLVRREEFEVVRDMATLARQENEHLAGRVAELEAALAGAPAKKSAAPRRAAAKKTTSRTTNRAAARKTTDPPAG